MSRTTPLLSSVLLASLTLAAPALAQEYVAKIGHLESTQQSRHIHLEKVAELVAERTDGDVEFQIFPQGQLGNQRQMNEGVQLGTLEATVAPAAFLGGFNPLVSILDIPYLIPEDADAAAELRDGPFGQALLDSFSDKGMVAIDLWPNGKKQFTSNEPLDSLEDFAGQKFRVMDSSILIEQFNALGASAIALPFGELYTSLQTGVVDGEENPLDTIKAMKFYEVQNYLVVSDHGAMEDVILFNPMFWDSLPGEYQTVIKDAFAEVIPELTAHKAAAVEAALETVKESGTNVRIADEEERAKFRDVMFAPASAAYVAKTGDAGQALLDTYTAAYDALK
ncbi:TRAP transporter substrate-binding protein [Celeribacter halophilus]|jgi:C4-dicarboxylate-binding protein DctP|uniref:C4-dicarboxylate-binding protein DctP n=1 Tax=Celeribacter halophilus TaxID=576117 RepID=A0A1I3Q467_9RHOB|nr:TRAP transporter substrate-binding protein [Celeribacter halophilus]MBU2890691.1 TRAP transporter substrate-binding protein [Celeribacter halophilus]MDO6510144.1 TRAP transporter substrate-binding protein [Celeribacter halophilus]PZX14048.1 C4-dicarboxylate-binding protein DctP [Celeribacter halophilus]SFJ28489.1 C4-dicarboxylate-binding protein DctP [Celeribacter halophilus]